MLRSFHSLYHSLKKPPLKQVYFRSLPLNRRLLLWYANRLVKADSKVEPTEQLNELNEMRCNGRPLTFISNHLTYADSHMIEIMFVRFGFKEMSDHIVHVAGQKTFDRSRYFLTRSLNTIRVYQPNANIDSMLRKRMNSKALKWAARLKRHGYSLLVFPEGTRTRTEKRFNLMSGNPRTTIYFRHSQVVPLGLMGVEEIMPVGSVLQKPATVTLRIGEPINHDELEQQFRKQKEYTTEKELQQSLMTHYMHQINNLLEPEYAYLVSSR